MGKSPEEGIKAPVKTSTTVQITLFGTGQVLNGVLTGTGDRVLVKNQTVQAENGTYMVGPDAWERTTDMNAADDLANGQLIVDSNTNVLYSIIYSGAWDPGATPLNFLVLLGAMPASIVLTSNSPIDLVDHDVPLNIGALDPSISPHLEFDFQGIQSKADDTTAAPLFLNLLGSYTQGPQIIAGDPGFEAGGIIIDGVTYQSALKASDLGGTNVAQFIMHRHHDTLPGILVGSRSRGNTGAHVLVGDNDTLMSLMAVGWDGVDYKQGAQMRFQVDGVAAAGDMPGRITFLTAPAGTTAVIERMRIGADGLITMANDLVVNGDQGVSIASTIPRFNMVDTDEALDQGAFRIGTSGMRILTDDFTVGYKFLGWTRSGTGAGIQVDTIDFTAVTAFTVDAPDLAVTGTVDGVDIDAFSTAMGLHVADGAIHFTQAAISIPASQISDFAAAVAANAAVALNTAKVTNVPTALSIGTHGIGTFGITSDGSANDVVIPSFTATLSGVIPGSGGGTANFMRADGSWAVPPGAGGITVTGTPANGQLAVWTSASDLEGDPKLILSGSRIFLGDNTDAVVDLTLLSSDAGNPALIFNQSSAGTVAFIQYIDSSGVIDFNCDGRINFNAFNIGNTLALDNNATAQETRLLIWDVDNGNLNRVSVGAANSGGAGFKLLRIPN